MKRNLEIESLRVQRGQGMMEYIIIVALIAVAAIGTYSMFGKTIRNQTAGMANEIAGKSGQESIDAAGQSSTQANSRATANKGMGKYNESNDQGVGAGGTGGGSSN
jgi:Flp pilus assembly pilin Flp